MCVQAVCTSVQQLEIDSGDVCCRILNWSVVT